MPSKIDANPLIVALFDIPDGVVQVKNSSKPKTGKLRHDRNATVTTSLSKASGLSDSGLRRLNQPDDTSLLHGENISLTDEEYSDAVAAHDHNETVQPENDTPPACVPFRPNAIYQDKSPTPVSGTRCHPNIPTATPSSISPEEYTWEGRPGAQQTVQYREHAVGTSQVEHDTRISTQEHRSKKRSK